MAKKPRLKALMPGIFIAAIVCSVWAVADSSTVSYQGQLRNTDGTAVPDGSYTFGFSIWDALAGGTQLWQETHSPLAVKNGRFSVDLGDTTDFGTLFADHSALWLEIAVDFGYGGETYAPRVPLTSVPYAKQAQNTANAVSANSATNAGNTDTVDGQHLAAAAHTHAGADITSGKIDNARLNTGSGNGLDADTVDAKHAAELSPPGVITRFAGANAPAGWLLCNGAAVSRTGYASLFAAIGTIYGAGDGSTTFNLPDLRGCILIGLDNMGGTAAGRVQAASGSTLGGTGGEENHTLTVNELPAHSHGVTDPGHAHPYDHLINEGGAANCNTGCNLGNWIDTDYQMNTSVTGISLQNAGSGGTHNTMAPYIAVNCIIKY